MSKLNSYDLSRNFWNWAFDNPEKISPNHAAIYFFSVEHCNRLGWKEKFGLPSQMVMDAIGIKKHSTYIRYFNDLVEYKFFDLIQKSKNQYSSNIISLTFALPKKGEALDKAISKHGVKHTAKQKEYIQTSKQVNIEQLNIDEIYKLYPSKCVVQNRSLGKTSKNKDQIKKLLKDRPVEELTSIINRYISECKKDQVYMMNFKTFLNNLPDYSSEPIKEERLPKFGAHNPFWT